MRLIAIGVSAILIIAAVGPGIAAACEGFTVEGEVEGTEQVKNPVDCSFNKELNKTCKVKLNAPAGTETMFGAWEEDAEAKAGYIIGNKASCENKDFMAGAGVCEVTAKLKAANSKNASLKIPITFLDNKGNEEGKDMFEVELLNP